MKQRQKAGARATQIKAPRNMDNGLLDQHKLNDYNTNKLKDSQFNGEADLDKIEDLNIGSNYYTLSCGATNLRPGINSLRCCYLASRKVGLIITFLDIRRSLKKIHE